jgi:multiple sugar transport system substrate-binding protein
LLLSAGAGAGLALTGCGGGGTAVQTAGDGGKTYKGPKVNLAFWNGLTGGEGPYIQDLVQEFNSQSKNIKVSMNIVEWDTFYQKVPSAVNTGEGPDVGIMHHDQLGTNAARGVIIPLDDVANALKLKESDFAPAVWNAGSYNNHRYGISLDIHPLGFYYNKGTMEKRASTPTTRPRPETTTRPRSRSSRARASRDTGCPRSSLQARSASWYCSGSSVATSTMRTLPRRPSTPRRASKPWSGW